MSDPSLIEFYDRIERIEYARAKGDGFDAAGTLGRSHFSPRRQRRGFLKPLLMLCMGVFGLKGAIYYNIGGDIYTARVEALKDGEGFEPLGAVLMQADPVTIEVSRLINRGVTWLTA